MADVSVVTEIRANHVQYLDRHIDALVRQRYRPRQWILWSPDLPGTELSESARIGREFGLEAQTSMARDVVTAMDEWQTTHALVLTAADWLASHALDRISLELDLWGEADLLYGDEVVWDDHGNLEPLFRPAWGPTLEECWGIVGDCPVVGRGVLKAGIPDGPHRWGDLAFEIAQAGGRIVSVPSILVNRRTPSPRRSAPWLPATGSPTVSIIVPTIGTRVTEADGSSGTPLVARMLASARDTLSGQADTEIVVVCDEGTPNEVIQVLIAQAPSSITVVHHQRRGSGFNFPDLVNAGAMAASGEILIFANDDLEFICPAWDRVLTAMAASPATGAVGSTLLYPDGTIQHAGFTVQLEHGGLPIHNNTGRDPRDPGNGDVLTAHREVHAVTGALIVVRRASFLTVGGFSSLFPSDYNDMDLCWKLQALGLRTVMAPDALAIHCESATRESRLDVEAAAKLRHRWAAEVRSDPWRNPNVAHEDWHAKPDWLAWERGAAVRSPWGESGFPVSQRETWGHGVETLAQLRSARTLT